MTPVPTTRGGRSAAVDRHASSSARRPSAAVERPPLGFAAPPERPLLLGMVHVQALPGTPFARLPLPDIVGIAVGEAEMLIKAGFDGVILENMHDRPYLKGPVGPEITAGMTAVAVGVRQALGPLVPVGIQILAGANREALAVALAAGLSFIRAEGFVFAHTADEGWIEACAGDLLRERRRLGTDHIKIWADIQKKHSAHSVTADLTIDDWAHGADFFGADALILTGSRTGVAADAAQLHEVKQACSLPVAIGSGLTPDNAHLFMAADAWIVGSWIKQDGRWENPLDPARLRRMVTVARRLRAPTA